MSIVSLVIIIIAGIKDKSCRSYGICAGIALGMMLVGVLGMNMVPKAYFGVVERFSVFAATGFNAVLIPYIYIILHQYQQMQLQGFMLFAIEQI